MNRKIKWISLGIMSALLIGCGWSKTAKGAAIGGGIGGVLGGIIGKKTGHTAAGVLLGAAVGGATGAAIGNYMDKQSEEMKKDLEGAKIERVGEGIKITFASGILFKSGKSALQAPAKENVQKLAKILNKYEDTEVLVQGHTDADGSEESNQKLSEERAAAVVRHTLSLGVNQQRLSAVGYGEEMPVADNSTPDGKAQNRRVEIAIFANDKLKKAAEDGTI